MRCTIDASAPLLRGECAVIAGACVQPSRVRACVCATCAFCAQPLSECATSATKVRPPNVFAKWYENAHLCVTSQFEYDNGSVLDCLIHMLPTAVVDLTIISLLNSSDEGGRGCSLARQVSSLQGNSTRVRHKAAHAMLLR